LRGKKAKQLRRELFDVVLSRQVADKMQGKNFKRGVSIIREIKKEYNETAGIDRPGFIEAKISGKKK
jgi:hypothetical protein